MNGRALKTVLEALALGSIFFVLAILSLAFTRFHGGAAFLWTASAPLLAYLLVRPMSQWIAPVASCAVASWLASTFFGVGPFAGIPIGIAIIGEACVAAAIMRKLDDECAAFENLRAVGLFFIAAGVIAPALSGMIGAVVIVLRTGQAFWPNWSTWYAAHALGMVAFAPLLMMLARGDARHWMRAASPRCKAEAVVSLVIVGLVSWAAFDQERFPLLFLPLFPLLIATFRLGRLGAALSVVILTAIGAVLTIHGHGPISVIHALVGTRIQFFQLYVGVAIMMVLPPAAELKRRERLFLQVQENQASYRLLADHVGDTIIHTGPDGEVRFVSSAALDLTGYAPAQIIGRNSSDFVIAKDLIAFEDARRQALADPERTITIEYRANTRSHGHEWRETRMRSYVDAHGEAAGVILVVRDVSQRKAAEAELAEEARTDPLTGLPNRRSFFGRLDQLQREVATAQRIGCVALLDIDFFKRVNDQHGHSAGDTVLKAVACAAREALRSSDMLARVGGEEFGIILFGASLEQATRTCERVRTAIESCCVQLPTGVSVKVTASLGVAQVDLAISPMSAFEAADAAMYGAKHGGRNRLVIAA